MQRTGLDKHGAYYQPIDDRNTTIGGMIVLLISTFDAGIATVPTTK
jgi:hypothetical protein